MDKFRTAICILVVILIRLADAFGFKDVMVGTIVAICSVSILFDFISNNVKRKDK